MTIGDIQQVFVRGKVDEADIGLVRLGMPARITTESFRDKIFQGKVTQISPIGVEKDNVTTFEVEVSIDNPGQELKANMTANAEIVLEEHARHAGRSPRPRSPTTPRRTPASTSPTQPPTPAAARVPVKFGIGNGTKTEVLEGLKQGERVVLPG